MEEGGDVGEAGSEDELVVGVADAHGAFDFERAARHEEHTGVVEQLLAEIT